ncbi:MAG: hypothetical protein KME21_01505 [Desmonostoc vinosum HA7617-LM4]|nr:hypothetical protein [Desmonostoc vinosum HA7617-LM4]
MQKSGTRQKINFLADNLSRFQPTNNSIFSPFQRTFAIRQRLESLTVQVFLQEVYYYSQAGDRYVKICGDRSCRIISV